MSCALLVRSCDSHVTPCTHSRFSPLPLNQNGSTHPEEEEEETLSRQLSEILSDSDEVQCVCKV